MGITIILSTLAYLWMGWPGALITAGFFILLGEILNDKT